MISITINGLTVSGDDEEQFAFALSHVGKVAELAREHGTALVRSPIVPRVSVPRVEGEPIQHGKGECVAKYLSLVGKSVFRRNREELESGQDEETCARIRLEAMGGDSAPSTYDPNAPSEGHSTGEVLSMEDIESEA